MRMDECQAAFLSVKLEFLSQWTQQRQELAAWYDSALKNCEHISLPEIAPSATHVYHLYVIKTEKRDALQKYLQENGIGTLIHYPIPPHLQEAYTFLQYQKGAFPIAEKMADTSLSLPLWPGMTQIQVEKVANTIKSFFQT